MEYLRACVLDQSDEHLSPGSILPNHMNLYMLLPYDKFLHLENGVTVPASEEHGKD